MELLKTLAQKAAQLRNANGWLLGAVKKELEARQAPGPAAAPGLAEEWVFEDEDLDEGEATAARARLPPRLPRPPPISLALPPSPPSPLCLAGRSTWRDLGRAGRCARQRHQGRHPGGPRVGRGERGVATRRRQAPWAGGPPCCLVPFAAAALVLPSCSSKLVEDG
ncbi:unnamed protein product, partial [Prorocentrum cordatum]